MCQENRVVIGEKYVLMDGSSLAFSGSAKEMARKDNYERLLNAENEWDVESPAKSPPSGGKQSSKSIVS